MTIHLGSVFHSRIGAVQLCSPWLYPGLCAARRRQDLRMELASSASVGTVGVAPAGTRITVKHSAVHGDFCVHHPQAQIVPDYYVFLVKFIPMKLKIKARCIYMCVRCVLQHRYTIPCCRCCRDHCCRGTRARWGCCRCRCPGSRASPAPRCSWSRRSVCKHKWTTAWKNRQAKAQYIFVFLAMN